MVLVWQTFSFSLAPRRCDPWILGFRKPVVQRPAAKSVGEFKDLFTRAGHTWPVDLRAARVLPGMWGLPGSAFVQLQGLSDRQVLMLMYNLVVKGTLKSLPVGGVVLTHTERGPRFHQPGPGVCTTAVPNMMLVVAFRGSDGWRLSHASPVEVYRMMGMPLPPEARTLSAIELVKIAGGAFHLPTACAFVAAACTLRRGSPRGPRPRAPGEIPG